MAIRPSPPPQSIASDTRARILRVALRRFREKGFDQVPVAEIVREAGVAKGTFFLHFPTKDHVLAEAFDRMLELAVQKASKGRVAGADAILAFLLALSGLVTRDRSLALAIIPRVALLPAPAPERKGQERPRGEERMREWIFERLGEALPIRLPARELDPEALAALLALSFRGTLEEWVREEWRAQGLHRSVRSRASFLLAAAGFLER